VKLGLTLETLDHSTDAKLALARHADEIGLDSVWVAEAYGCDAVSPLGWLAATTSRITIGTAVLQLAARTAVATAMAAVTVQRLSRGRFVLGLGVSNPQVVSGWYGQVADRPLAHTREYVEVVRRVLRRERLEFAGERIRIPATDGVKSLKLMTPPPDSPIPIHLAALGPRNVALTTEIADGWLPLWFSPARVQNLYGELISKPDFEIAPLVNVVLGDDPAECRDRLRPKLALYIGGMGSREQNHYTDLVARYGYGDRARDVQELYLAGRREEAVRLVPDELIDEVALCGPEGRIRELLTRWTNSPVSTLIACTEDPRALDVLRRLVPA
jgi:F420-dependent oxidoreductase-like protein